MLIERKRYVVMRKGRTEVWCGLAKNFSFRPVSEIKDVAVKTYRSEAQAESGCSSWDRDFEVVPVVETIAMEDEAPTLSQTYEWVSVEDKLPEESGGGGSFDKWENRNFWIPQSDVWP